MELVQQLENLPEPVSRLLHEYRFDQDRLLRLAAGLKSGARIDNLVKGQVSAPLAEDVVSFAHAGAAERERWTRIGLEALAGGQVALVVLAGGMATRMGGVVKALVDAVPGKTFLDLRLREAAAIERLAGRPVPLWLMTSSATDAKLRQALGSQRDGKLVASFPQHLSIRLTPSGDLFRDAAGQYSLHAPGHGDLPDALRESGLLRSFVQEGGRVVMVANIDNLGATVDPAIVGWHLEHGSPVSCEVVDKIGSDRGGIPIRVDGRPVVLEEFRIPPMFDPATVRVFNTNTFLFDARALQSLDIPWTFFTVTKRVDGLPAIQFERLVGEVTSYLNTRFLRVPRTGDQSRFLPVKDPEELLDRQSEIEEVARARGMLP